MIKTKKIREPEYDFSSTGFPELDAINGLIKLADRYARDGNIEKANELCNKAIEALEALDKIRDKVIK